MAAKRKAAKTTAKKKKTTAKPGKGTKLRVSQSHEAKKMVAALLAFVRAHGLLDLPRKRVRAGRVVDTAFMEAAASAWDKFGARTGMKTFDSDGARQAIAQRAAFKDPIDTAHLVARRMEYTLMQPYMRHNKQALSLYKLMTVLAGVEGNEDLLPSVEKMAKLLATGPRAPKPPAKT